MEKETFFFDSFFAKCNIISVSNCLLTIFPTKFEHSSKTLMRFVRIDEFFCRLNASALFSFAYVSLKSK